MTDQDRIHRWLTQADLERMLDEAFAHGAEAMREAAIAKTDDKLTVLLRNSLNEYRVRQAVTDAIRALPVPEDK